MVESLFASKAELGQQYVTKSGWPVTVLQKDITVYGKKGIKVRNDLTEVNSVIYEDQLLRPYSAKLISQEAMAMGKISKAAGKKSGEKAVRGESRGAQKSAEGILLFRHMKGARHEVLLKDGVLLYRTKKYPSLKEVAEAIRGKAVSGSGRSFFGLRSEPNITLGKEVVKELASAHEEKAAKVKKAKAKKAEAEDDEDEAKTPKSVGELVAKTFGKGRR